MQDWISNTRLAAVPLLDLGFALAAAALSYSLMLLGLRLVTGRLRRAAARTRTNMDDVVVDVLAGTSRWLLLVAALLVGVGLLDLGPAWNNRIGQAWFVALALQLALWATRAITTGVRNYELRHRGDGAQVSASGTLLSWLLRTLLWAVVLLAVLSNIGVNITAFVASLGVGGIAVALAVQNILADLFASMAIAVDKPFEVGDFISSDAGAGTVEYVGLKTTRIRALGGEQIIVANTDLLKQPVKNFRRMQERRIAFHFGVTYGTPADLAEAIPGIVERLVRADGKLRFDRAHFFNFGESSLDYEVVYYVLSADYGVYMDAQQRLNLGLLREFGVRGIEFAFPTRTLYLATESGGASAPERVAGAAHAAAQPQPQMAPAWQAGLAGRAS